MPPVADAPNLTKGIAMRVKSVLDSGLAAIGLTFCLGTQPALAFVTVSVQPANQVVFVGSNPAFNALVSTTALEAYRSSFSPDAGFMILYNPLAAQAGAVCYTSTSK